MRINKIIEDSRANGPGTRYTIWVQGCSIHCKGCFNTDTWPADGGYEMSVDDILQDIKRTPVNAVSITGGEPLDQYEEIIELLGLLTGYNILLTTGYTYDMIRERFPKILHAVDILIDGPFMADKVDRTASWRGSTNQGIHFLTTRSLEYKVGENVNAEVRIEPNGNAIITGFGIPESFQK